MQQITFDPLDYDQASCLPGVGPHGMAKLDRDALYHKLRREGKQVKRSILRNQLRKYASFGVSDGRTRDIYYLHVYEPKTITVPGPGPQGWNMP